MFERLFGSARSKSSPLRRRVLRGESLENRQMLTAWTVMVYLDADNNLEGAGIDDFREMAQVANPNVNIVVQFDRATGYDSSNGDWTGAKRFAVNQGMAPTAANAVSDLGEVNMGSAATLQSFVSWAHSNYQADHYALILWDHGGGWKGGICSDDSSGDVLSMTEVRQALAGATASSWRFDTVGMDACLMGGLEVAAEVQNYTNYFVASAELEDGDGWEYQDILAANRLTATTDAATWSQYCVTSFANRYNPNNGDSTLMAADMSRTSLVSSAVSALASSLIANMASERTNISASVSASRRYEGYYLDLYDFCDELAARAASATVRTQANAVKSAINSMLKSYWKDAQYGGSTDGQRCLSIYFPPSSGDSGMGIYNGSTLRFLADANQHWDEMLTQFFNSTPSTPDSDDQIREAANLGAIQGTLARNGSVAEPTDVDMFRFTVSRGQRVTFDIDRPSGNLDSYLRLFDAAGNQLTFNDDAPGPGEASSYESYLDYTFTNAGTYYLGISGYGNSRYNATTGAGDASGSIGAYALVINGPAAPADNNDQICEARALGSISTSLTTTGHNIDVANDVDMFSVTVRAGQRLAIDIDRPSGNFDSYLRLFDRNGNQLAANDDAPAPDEGSSFESYLAYTFNQAGTYYIGVSGYGNSGYNAITGANDGSGSTGSFTLVVSNLPSAGSNAALGRIKREALIDSAVEKILERPAAWNSAALEAAWLDLLVQARARQGSGQPSVVSGQLSAIGSQI